MTRLLVLLAVLVLLAAAGAGAAAGEAADTAAAAQSSSGPPPYTVAQTTPGQQPENPPGTFGAFLSDNHEAFRTYGLIFGGLAGLIFAFWRARIATRQAKAAAARADAASDQARAANEQARIAEQGHITEDYVECDHLAVMDVITNFVRHPPYTNEQRQAAGREKTLRAFRTNSAKENVEADQIDRADPTAGVAAPPEPESIDCPDIVVAIEIIQGRSDNQKAVEEVRDCRPSLTRASLSYLRLPEVDLQYFDLMNANLTGAKLTRTKLTSADLTGAKLTRAKLTSADLTGADLRFARLNQADLAYAGLPRANLTDVDLTNAKNLTQEQLDAIRYSSVHPPKLPPGLVLPDPPAEPEAESAGAAPPEAL